jgi:serine/threonine protein kinase
VMKQMQSGTVFTGKWTGQSFKIAKCLGEGANGAVYFAYSEHGYGALKFCQQASDAALEWNILEQVSKVQASFPRPILIDDWEKPSGTTYFYVMEWVSGKPLDQSVQQLDASLYYQAVEKIVLGLSALHAAGMAFCDIKPQNILVATDSAVKGAVQNSRLSVSSTWVVLLRLGGPFDSLLPYRIELFGI